MKLTISIASGILLVPLVATFAPSLVVQRKSARSAASDDLVNAYKKVKPEASIPEISINIPEPIVDPIPIVPHIDTLSVPEISIPVPDVPAVGAGATKSAVSAADAVGANFNFVNDFLKSAQDYKLAAKAAAAQPRDVPTLGDLLQRNFGSGSSIKATITEFSPTAGGKAPSLAGFLKSGVGSNGEASVYDESQISALANAKAKIAMMVSNTYHLFGSKGPSTGGSSSSSITTPIEIPEGAVGVGLVGIALLLAAGAKKSRNSAATADATKVLTGMVEKEASAVSELAEAVVSLCFDKHTGRRVTSM
jgi:hypothetical protein